ncbi:MAG TPA: AarF/ABC1/UbiB kinase family protein [Kofleriaceae bacterium]|jgi:predicted unusual protein kinase regulating ubiquinone biosynthesis (AarF/ABC1/UbiB family)|nr:AarF/ABC1/UbiB kinase family protein [Kofleriaceae bacterium]
MADDLDELTRGVRRMWSTASLTSKLGAKAAGRMLFRKHRPMEAPGGEAEARRTEAAVASARQLVARMGQLKGLVMKAGQIASYMPGTLPPAAQAVLAELQAHSTPMAYARIALVLHAELGDGPWFEMFSETPFASASIGQVHRATYAGAPVAVKIQYPGIADAIQSDLKMVSVIARMSMLGSPSDGGALANELRDRLLEECDYRREAQNQVRFGGLLASVPGASVPQVIAARSSERVLTTSFVDAAPLGALADQAVRDRAGQIIFRACFELIFRRCVYNADPHPGNYLVAPDGAVTFLDFGCVRQFDPQMIATWRAMARAILDGDRAGFADGFRALGFVGKDKGFDWDYQWSAMRELYRPYLTPTFRYEPELVRNSFGLLMFDNPNRFRIAMPPEWLFLNRLQWGLNAVLAQLRATGPWRAILEDIFAMPIEPSAR